MRRVDTDERDLKTGRKELEKRLKEMLEEVGKRRGKEGEEKEGWWDEECWLKKR